MAFQLALYWYYGSELDDNVRWVMITYPSQQRHLLLSPPTQFYKIQSQLFRILLAVIAKQ